MDRADVRARAAKVINEFIRPALQAGGGDIELVDVDQDSVALVRLLGGCGACPSTAMSILHGIEQELRDKVPEVAYVEVVSAAD